MQFRDGRRQLVGIMELSSVPPETAVTEGRYSYTPCPIHEPPVPDNIFMHLLSAAGEHSDLNGAREFRKKSERVFCTTTLKHYLWHGEVRSSKAQIGSCSGLFRACVLYRVGRQCYLCGVVQRQGYCCSYWGLDRGRADHVHRSTILHLEVTCLYKEYSCTSSLGRAGLYKRALSSDL